MPHQPLSPPQPCSASRPLSLFGEQRGTRLHPTARDSRLEPPMISPNRKPTTLPRPLLNFSEVVHLRSQRRPISSNQAPNRGLTLFCPWPYAFGDRSLKQHTNAHTYASREEPDASQNGLITEPFSGKSQSGHKIVQVEINLGNSLIWPGIWKSPHWRSRPGASHKN